MASPTSTTVTAPLLAANLSAPARKRPAVTVELLVYPVESNPDPPAEQNHRVVPMDNHITAGSSNPQRESKNTIRRPSSSDDASPMMFLPWSRERSGTGKTCHCPCSDEEFLMAIGPSPQPVPDLECAPYSEESVDLSTVPSSLAPKCVHADTRLDTSP